jgi:hypothetical protein
VTLKREATRKDALVAVSEPPLQNATRRKLVADVPFRFDVATRRTPVAAAPLRCVLAVAAGPFSAAEGPQKMEIASRKVVSAVMGGLPL